MNLEKIEHKKINIFKKMFKMFDRFEVLIVFFVVSIIALLIVAVNNPSPRYVNYENLKIECQTYGNFPLEKIPAKCVKFFYP